MNVCLWWILIKNIYIVNKELIFFFLKTCLRLPLKKKKEIRNPQQIGIYLTICPELLLKNADFTNSSYFCHLNPWYWECNAGKQTLFKGFTIIVSNRSSFVTFTNEFGISCSIITLSIFKRDANCVLFVIKVHV